jgi:hypothetical protein
VPGTFNIILRHQSGKKNEHGVMPRIAEDLSSNQLPYNSVFRFLIFLNLIRLIL